MSRRLRWHYVCVKNVKEMKMWAEKIGFAKDIFVFRLRKIKAVTYSGRDVFATQFSTFVALIYFAASKCY